MKRFLIALSFLTTLPVKLAEPPKPGDQGWAAACYPLAGLVIGLFLAGFQYVFNQLFTTLLAAALVALVWAALTGGLHLDGLADCCDGLLSAVSRERRLEILRDPRLGSFGGAGLALFLILKVSAIAAVIQNGTHWIWQPILGLTLAPVLARWFLLPVGRLKMVRPGGLGAEFSLGLRPRDLPIAAILPVFLILISGWRGVLAALLAGLAVWGAVRLAQSRLGGLTGDVLGLVIELSELAVLLAFAIHIPGLA